MFNFVQAAAWFTVAVTNIVNTVIQTVTGGQGGLAEAAQTVTNIVNNAFNDKGDRGDDNDDNQSDAVSTLPGLSSQERMRFEQEQQARAFDNDIAQQHGLDDQGASEADSDAEANFTEDVVSMALEINLDTAVTVLTATNPVAFTMWQVARHEPKLLRTATEVLGNPADVVKVMSAMVEEGTETFNQVVELIKTIRQQEIPPILDSQRDRLTELGVEVPDNAEITQEEAQEIIDFYETNPNLLEDMDLDSVRESLEIIERSSSLGFEVALSEYNPLAWNVERLRIINEVLDTMSETAANRFRSTYGDQRLIALARAMGLQDEQVNDAALLLLISGDVCSFCWM